MVKKVLERKQLEYYDFEKLKELYPKAKTFVIIDEKGIGKSFWSKEYSLKPDREVLHLEQYKTDLDDQYHDYFAPVHIDKYTYIKKERHYDVKTKSFTTTEKETPKYQNTPKGLLDLETNKIKTHYAPISLAHKYKKFRQRYINVTDIVYDEFCKQSYPNNEYKNLTLWMKTVEETDRGVIVWLFGNADYWNYNYIKHAWGINKLDTGVTQLKGGKIVICFNMFGTPEIKEAKKSSVGSLWGEFDGQNLIDDDNMSIGNDEENIYIYDDKKDYMYNIKLNNNLFGVWKTKEGLTYISTKNNKTGKVYVFDKKDLADKTQLISTSTLSEWYELNNENRIIFESHFIKQQVMDYVKYKYTV